MGKETFQIDFRISKMEGNDLPAVAKIHKKAWRADHFSSRLSIPLLQVYYGNILKHNPYCFVAERNNNIIGFATGGSNTRVAIKEFIKENFFSMLIVVIKNPSFLLSRIKNYFAIMSSSNTVNSIANVRLLAIAVDPEIEGKGVATALLRTLENAVKSDGHKYFGLSVHKDNERAIRLYDSLGWQVEKKEGSAIYYIMKFDNA